MSEEIYSYAVTEKFSRGRAFSENRHPYRSDFERDRDRIIHCSAFRRLEGKTQVFTPGLDDYYRTRLTHSIEVAQIGRTIAKALRINVNLTEAICLAHDLGHPPFGHTGEQIDAMVFMGPTYYLSLKHMVQDKVHSRSNGPSVLLTRQPTEGRSRDGGLRIGEMERDVILSHGIMQFLKERLFDCSDKYFVSVCKETGMIAAVNPAAGVYKSLYSEDNSTDFVKVQLPYASKLFIQEMMGFGLAPRMKV